MIPLRFLLVIISLHVVFTSAYEIVVPGPKIKATQGGVWPKPQKQTSTANFLIIQPHNFHFTSSSNVACPNLWNELLHRYWKIVSITNSVQYGDNRNKNHAKDPRFLGFLETVNVQLTGPCANDDVRPEFGMNENYTLSINANNSVVTAQTIWGIMRGLETFSQLIYFDNDEHLINVTTIEDFPRFSHRGLLIDTSRHFIPVDILLENLDAMAYNKLNVFHWHIVDDQSFPYKSVAFPELSERGAYHPVLRVYEQSDIKRIIEYARARGIRVIAEFDMPGHTRSWGASHPELLTECYTGASKNGAYGPMNPLNPDVYVFLEKLFVEIIQVFPDAYFHIGGDEVDFGCWQSNPTLAAYVKTNNITFARLESEFIQKVVNILDRLKSKHVVWEEVFSNGVVIANTTVVQVWKGNGMAVLNNVTAAGHFAIYSACWYLDSLSNDFNGDWLKFYKCNLMNFNGTEAQRKLVIGGEVCMWSEVVDETNVISRMWPRGSATAEKLWSSENVKDIADAEKRLEEHACRLKKRGITASPANGPGVCL